MKVRSGMRIIELLHTLRRNSLGSSTVSKTQLGAAKTCAYSSKRKQKLHEKSRSMHVPGHWNHHFEKCIDKAIAHLRMQIDNIVLLQIDWRNLLGVKMSWRKVNLSHDCCPSRGYAWGIIVMNSQIHTSSEQRPLVKNPLLPPNVQYVIRMRTKNEKYKYLFAACMFSFDKC